MLLPEHRSSPSKTDLSTGKRPSFVKQLLRWLVLACVVITVIRVGDLLSLGGRFNPLFRPSNDTTTTNRFQRPLNVPPPPTKEEQDFWNSRKNEVRNAFKHAWSGYKSVAYPYDELLPVSGGYSNKFFFPSFLLPFVPLTFFLYFF